MQFALAQLIFSPETHGIHDAWGGQYLLIGSVFVSYAQVSAFVMAVIAVLLVELILHRTRWGQVIRAVADDAETALLASLNALYVHDTKIKFEQINFKA